MQLGRLNKHLKWNIYQFEEKEFKPQKERQNHPELSTNAK